jgi:sugar/nucleoside kinase (ribokinase family)
MLHAVQMNEDEAAGLTPDGLDEDDLAKHVLALNTGAMFITRGSRGATAFIDVHKQIQRTEIDGVAVKHVLDPTGCGDVFGAAYCAHFLHTKNIQESARFANRVAAANAELKGSADIERLSSFRINRTATAEVQS